MSLKSEGRGMPLRLVLGEQTADGFEKSSDFISVVEKDFVSEGETWFSKGELLGIIQQIAQAEGFGKDQIFLKRIRQDKSGNIIGLDVLVSSSRAKGEGFGAIEYSYDGPGRGSSHSSAGHFVIRFCAKLDDVNDWRGANPGLVAEYVDGKWRIEPNRYDQVAEWAAKSDD